MGNNDNFQSCFTAPGFIKESRMAWTLLRCAFEATPVTELHGMWVDHTYAQDGGHGRPNGGAKEIMEIGDGWLIDTKAVKLLHLHGAGHAMYLEKDYYQTTREAILKFISE